MDVCVLSQEGAVLLHRNRQAASAPCLKAVAPYRDGLVVAVECLFTWYWLAALWADEGMPFVLGHALYMKAIYGGKAKNDKSDSHKIAAWLRGGMLPQAYGYPAELRAPRDLPRRRTHLRRKRAELLSHVQKTHSLYNLPESGQKIADKANHTGVAERLADPAVPKPIAGALALITYDAQLLHDLALSLANCQATRRSHPLSMTNRARHRPHPPPRVALRNPSDRPVPKRAGVRFVLPPRHV